MVELPQYLTIEDNLKLEAGNPDKHEYVDGQVYAMAGASDSYVTIAGNLFAALLAHIERYWLSCLHFCHESTCRGAKSLFLS